MRFTLSLLLQCLQLITMVTQALVEFRLDAQDLLRNLTHAYIILLTERHV